MHGSLVEAWKRVSPKIMSESAAEGDQDGKKSRGMSLNPEAGMNGDEERVPFIDPYPEEEKANDDYC